jgi:hypothetical protein
VVHHQQDILQVAVAHQEPLPLGLVVMAAVRQVKLAAQEIMLVQIQVVVVAAQTEFLAVMAARVSLSFLIPPVTQRL